MNKNVLYFYAHFNNMVYYSQLYYALETLNKHYDDGFDVVVYYTPSKECADFSGYRHINGGNLVKDFPKFQFIRSDYHQVYDLTYFHDKTRTHDPYMGKWYHVPQLFKMGYEKVFLLDTDTIFFGDINPIFGIHDDPYKMFVTLVWDQSFNKIQDNFGNLNFNAMSSNQVVIDSKLSNSWDTFYQDCVSARVEMCNQADILVDRKIMTLQEKFGIYFFSEQYAPQKILSEYGAKFFELNKKFLSLYDDSSMEANKENRSGTEWYDMRLNSEKNDIEIVNSKSKIVHYASCNTAYYLPKRLRLPYMEAEVKSFIEKNKMWFTQ